MTALMRYLSGYVHVELSGYAMERFLNLCTNHGILIWNMEHGEETYEFSMGLRDFFKIRPLVRKTRTHVRVLDRYGFPFFLHRYRKRKTFLLGFLLGSGLIYAFSCYIWNIEICGNSTLSADTICQYLEQEQVKIGAPKKKIDCEELEAQIRQHFSNVIWTSVRLEGTKLTVDIKENLVTKEPGEQAGEEAQAQDLVADKEAQIVSIVTRNGTPMVQAGEQVQNGTLLVSGRIEILDDAGEIKNYQYCRADADVLAQTSYPYTYTVSKKLPKKVYTGEVKNKYSIWFRKKYIRLYQGKVHYRLYDRETEKIQLCIMKNFYLPFYLQKDSYREYRMKDYEVEKKEAEKMAMEDLELFLSKLEEKGLQIIEKNVMMDTEKKNYTFHGTIRTLETLGIHRDTEILEVQKEGTAENEFE